MFSFHFDRPISSKGLFCSVHFPMSHVKSRGLIARMQDRFEAAPTGRGSGMFDRDRTSVMFPLARDILGNSDSVDIRKLQGAP